MQRDTYQRTARGTQKEGRGPRSNSPVSKRAGIIFGSEGKRILSASKTTKRIAESTYKWSLSIAVSQNQRQQSSTIKDKTPVSDKHASHWKCSQSQKVLSETRGRVSGSTRELSPCEKDLSWVTVQCSKSANYHLWVSRGTFRCHSTDYLIVKIVILLYLIISIVWWVTLDHLLLLVYCIYICCSSTW